MLRWWNNDSYSTEKPCPPEEFEEEEELDQSEMRKWRFRVRASTIPGETVCVTGNCDSLGNWKHDKALILTKEKDEKGCVLQIKLFLF